MSSIQEIREKEISKGTLKEALKEGRILKETTSVCPACIEEGRLHVIPARIIESDGKILYEKECEKHGKFQDIYWSDADMYKRAEKFRWEGKGPVVVRVKRKNYDYKCPQDCVGPLTGLCGYHKTRTCLGIIDVTNRCNLRCPTCFANAGAMDYIYEPSIEELENAFRAVKANAGKAIQLTGGEPTVRDDLPEIVKKAKEYFPHVEVNTNGIRISRDKEFAKKLGRITFYLSYDTENDPSIYEKYRGHGIYNPNTRNEMVEGITGQDLINIKKKAIDNIEEVGGSVVFIPTTSWENIDQAWPIIKYAMNRGEVIRGVNFQPISFGGRGNIRERFTIPDLIHRIEKDSNGTISRDDWYPVPIVAPMFDIAEYFSGEPLPSFTIHPHCGMATILIEIDKKWIPLPRLLNVEKFHEAITEIARNLSKEKIKMFGKLKAGYDYYSKIRPILKEAHPFIKKAVEKILDKRDYTAVKDFFADHRVLFLGSMHFQDPNNIDFQRTRRCGIHQAYPDGSLMSFCIINSGLVAKNGMTTRDAKMRQFGISWQEYLAKIKSQKQK